MSIPYQCPSCSRQLYYSAGENTFQVCRFCGSKIIVPSAVIHQQEALEAQPTERMIEDQRNFKIAEIQSELNAGRKIHAINMFREAFAADLATAKTAVDMLEQGQRLPREALARVRQDVPIEQKVHGTAPVQPVGTVKSAPIIFWMIISIGIAIAVIFLRGQ